jgi:hypothetical protein
VSDATTLYDRDFVTWSREQADALRAASRGGSNQKLDWENLAEEIESLGKSERHSLKSQIQRVVEHLLKLQHSPAVNPRTGWIDSINSARTEIELVLEDSPSLRTEVAASIAAALKRAERKVFVALEEYGELDAAARSRIRATTYTPEQILGDWFPPSHAG